MLLRMAIVICTIGNFRKPKIASGDGRRGGGEPSYSSLLLMAWACTLSMRPEAIAIRTASPRNMMLGMERSRSAFPLALPTEVTLPGVQRASDYTDATVRSSLPAAMQQVAYQGCPGLMLGLQPPPPPPSSLNNNANLKQEALPRLSSSPAPLWASSEEQGSPRYRVRER